MSLAVGVGLISGIDFNDLVGKLIEVERRPIVQQEIRRDLLDSRLEAFNTIDLRLNALRDAVRDIDSVLDFSTRETAISESGQNVFSATANSSAVEGSSTLEVLQLAANERRASQGFESDTATSIAPGDGTFQFRVGGAGAAITSIDVNAGTTLAELRDAINNASAEISATIVNDGSDTNAFRLVLVALTPGADNSIEIVTNGTTLDFINPRIENAAAQAGNDYTGSMGIALQGGFSDGPSRNVVIEVTSAGAVGVAQFKVSLDGGLTFGPDNAFTTATALQDISGGQDIEVSFTDDGSTFAVGDRFTFDAFNPVLQKAQNAILRIDGLKLTRTSNTITDAISGVTLKLTGVSSSPATLTVSTDKSEISERINTFVEAYNSLVEEVNTLTAFDPATKESGPLNGDSTTKSIRTTLANIISSGIASSEGLLSLGQIGISFQRASLGNGLVGSFDGSLQVDLLKLNAAIENDFEKVKSVFALVGGSSSESVSFITASSATRAGEFAISITQAAERAQITGNQVIPGGGLTLSELLTFTVGDNSFSATLAPGAQIAGIISTLNTVFDAENSGLEAIDQGGQLSIRSKDFGSLQSFSVVSSRADAAGQTGFGTTSQSSTGKDVIALIDGRSATGVGQVLRGVDGTSSQGLQLLVSAVSTTSATITLSRGVASQMLDAIGLITDSIDGVLKVRRDGVNAAIDDINDRIRNMESRLVRKETDLRRQFTRLEVVLAQFQIQAEFLAAQLAQLSNLQRRN